MSIRNDAQKVPEGWFAMERGFCVAGGSGG
jgi:hypothetical protein